MPGLSVLDDIEIVKTAGLRAEVPFPMFEAGMEALAAARIA